MGEREDWPKHPETVRWLNDVARLLADAEREHRAVTADVSMVEYSHDDTRGTLPDERVEVTITIESKPGTPQEPQP